MKEIICSETTTSALKNLQTALEVIFGRTALICSTTERGGCNISRAMFNIEATARVFYPHKADLKVSSQLMMLMENGNVFLDPGYPGEIQVDFGSGNHRTYKVWFLPELNCMKIGHHYSSTAISPAVWLMGDSAENRWTEPYFEGQTTGLSYEI